MSFCIILSVDISQMFDKYSNISSRKSKEWSINTCEQDDLMFQTESDLLRKSVE